MKMHSLQGPTFRSIDFKVLIEKNQVKSIPKYMELLTEMQFATVVSLIRTEMQSM